MQPTMSDNASRADEPERRTPIDKLACLEDAIAELVHDGDR